MPIIIDTDSLTDSLSQSLNKFENPTKVFSGSKKDMVISTVEDISFFCSADSKASIELG